MNGLPDRRLQTIEGNNAEENRRGAGHRSRAHRRDERLRGHPDQLEQPHLHAEHNGKAIGPNGIEVDLVKVFRTDLTHDGVLDAALLFDCSAAPLGGNGTSSEIQIFTRDAKPVARLVQPDRYGSGNPFGSQFNASDIRVVGNVLYTGAYGYLPSDAHCCPSAYDVYQWQ